MNWVEGAFVDAEENLFIAINPAMFSDVSKGANLGAGARGYPSKFTIKNALGNQWLIPTEANGSVSTYIPDYWNTYVNSIFRVGGGYEQGLPYGLFYSYAQQESAISGSIVSRLMVLP